MSSWWIFGALALVLLVLVYKTLTSEGMTKRFWTRSRTRSANEILGQHPSVGRYIASKEPCGFTIVRQNGEWQITESDLDNLFGHYLVDVVNDEVVGVAFGIPNIVNLGSLHSRVWVNLPSEI